MKINEDIANANRKIVQQNAELLAAVRANERIRRNRSRNMNINRNRNANRAAYYRNNARNNEDEVIAAEQRIREVFQLNRDINNENNQNIGLNELD